MTFKSLLAPSNRRMRWLVGLLLAGLLLVQFTTDTEAYKSTTVITVLKGEDLGETAPSVLKKLETLAKTDHAALLEYCLSQHNFGDYTGTLVKQERIGGDLGKEQEVTFRFREKPFSVAMEWTRNPGLGDRVLFVEGRYGDQMLVRPTNALFRKLLGTVKKDPRGKEARQRSLRTVDQFGFRNSIHSLLEFYRKGKAEGVMTQEFGEYAEVEGRKCIVLIRYLPDGPEWPSYKTWTYIDLDWLVPICVKGHNEAGELVCNYVYKDVKFNMGLTDEHFTTKSLGMPEPK